VQPRARGLRCLAAAARPGRGRTRARTRRLEAVAAAPARRPPDAPGRRPEEPGWPAALRWEPVGPRSAPTASPNRAPTRRRRRRWRVRSAEPAARLVSPEPSPGPVAPSRLEPGQRHGLARPVPRARADRPRGPAAPGRPGPATPGRLVASRRSAARLEPAGTPPAVRARPAAGRPRGIPGPAAGRPTGIPGPACSRSEGSRCAAGSGATGKPAAPHRRPVHCAGRGSSRCAAAAIPQPGQRPLEAPGCPTRHGPAPGFPRTARPAGRPTVMQAVGAPPRLPAAELPMSRAPAAEAHPTTTAAAESARTGPPPAAGCPGPMAEAHPTTTAERPMAPARASCPRTEAAGRPTVWVRSPAPALAVPLAGPSRTRRTACSHLARRATGTGTDRCSGPPHPQVGSLPRMSPCLLAMQNPAARSAAPHRANPNGLVRKGKGQTQV